jgi:hypothetical protein
MSPRFSFSSTKYGPSVFEGVITQVAAAAASTSAAPNDGRGRPPIR